MTLMSFFFLLIEDADDRIFMENLYTNYGICLLWKKRNGSFHLHSNIQTII